MTTTSRVALIGTRSLIGIGTTWLALLLLTGHVPPQSSLVASLPALFGAKVALLAGATLLVAGVCLLFRILDRLLLVLLGGWSLAVVVTAWKLGAPLYHHGNPFLLADLGWELVITMIAVVASAGLAWATRAAPTKGGDTYLSYGGAPRASRATRVTVDDDHHAFAADHRARDAPAPRPAMTLASAVPFAVPPSPIGAAPALIAAPRRSPAAIAGPQPPVGGAPAAPPGPVRPSRHDVPTFDRTFAALLGPLEADTRHESRTPAHRDATTGSPLRPGDHEPFVGAARDAGLEDATPRRRAPGHDNSWVNL